MNKIKKREITEESIIVKQKRFYNHLFQQYYIINFIFLFLYPILRSLNIIYKPNNEIMLVYVTTFMVILKILKNNNNIDKLLTGIIFNLKLSTLILLYYSGEAKIRYEEKQQQQLLNHQSSELFTFDSSSDNNNNNNNHHHHNDINNNNNNNTGILSNIIKLEFHYGFYYILVYLVLSAIVYLIKSQPEPKQSHHVMFLNQLSLKELIFKSSNSKSLNEKYILLELYTTWSPPCTYLASTFADLSFLYPEIKFGKVDIGRWKNIGYEYDINDSIKSKQIPTIILFKNGKEQMRLPYRKDEFQLPYDTKKLPKDEKLFVPTNFTFDDIKNYFNLEKLKNEINSHNKSISNKKKIN